MQHHFLRCVLIELIKSKSKNKELQDLCEVPEKEKD